MKGLRKSIALAAVAAALAITLAACGSTSGGSGSGSGEKTTYTNGVYGFTITYGDPLSQVNLTPSGGEKYAIAFADKDGPLVDDQYANGLRVSVHDMGQTIKPADVPKLQDQLTKALTKMIAAITDGKLTGKVTPLELNGTPGFSVDYQFTKGGEQLTCRLTILVKGKYEYDLTEQAVAKDWDSLSGTLDETVQTFTLD